MYMCVYIYIYICINLIEEQHVGLDEFSLCYSGVQNKLVTDHYYHWYRCYYTFTIYDLRYYVIIYHNTICYTIIWYAII